MIARERWLKRSYAQDLQIFSTPGQKFGLVGLIVVGVAFPSLASGIRLEQANLVLMAVLGALALNLLTGIAGQASLGNAAMMAVGGYTAAFVAVEHDLGFLAALIAGTLVSCLVGVAVGVPALRLRGMYLVIGTLALQFIVVYLAQQYQEGTVGPGGFFFENPSILGWEITTRKQWYFLLLVCALGSSVLFANLLRSKYGRAWEAVRDADIAAEITGVNVSRYKVLVFVISSGMIGFQGVLFAYYARSLQSETYSLSLAITYVAMVIIGGLGTVLGSWLGAAFVTFLPFWVRDIVDALPTSAPGYNLLNDHLYDVQLGLYGLSIVLFLLFEPRGLRAIWLRIVSWIRLWPFSRQRLESGA